MQPNSANIKAVITAEDRASKTLKNFGDEADKMSGRMKAGLLVAGTAAVGFAATSVKAFMESQNVMAQTNAVIKSTGGVAGVSAKQVNDLAASLQKVTKFSDETIQQGENLLLTFTKIGKDIFPEATEVMLNMSQALGQDVKNSAIQLGKALQDPILGVTALRRVGVNFNDAQKEVIKNLVDTGRSAEAQRIILNELQVEFGNSARAAGETFAGRLAILKNTFNNVQEGIGQFLVNGLFRLITSLQSTWAAMQPVVQTLINFFRPSVEALVNTFQTRLLPSLLQLHAALSPGVYTALRIVATIIGAVLVGAIWVLINAINVTVSVMGGLIRVVSNIIGWFGNLAGAAIGTANTIAGAFRGAFNAIASAWNRTVGRLSFRAPDWIPGLGGRGWDVPDIPGLAEGGIVRSPTLAMIGEKGPEAVVPLNKGMPAVNITIQAGAFMGTQLEARKFADMIMRAYSDLASSKNRTPAQMLGG